MNLTDEQAALMIDPERERAGWWKDEVDIEDRTVYPACIPPLTTDRVAAFTHVTPVLLAAGCEISENSLACVVMTIGRSLGPYLQDVSSASSYPAATTAALAWLAEHEPERLRKALEGGE